MKSSLEKTWDKQTDYLNHWQFRKKNLHNNTLINWLKQIPKGKVLDAGCGLGQYTIYSSKLGYNATGIDISKKCLELARKNLKKYKVKAKLIFGDVRKLPFKDNSFNAVISTGVVEHFPETQKAIDEAYRVLRSGGELLIYVPHRYTIFILNKKLQQLLGIWKAGYESSFSIPQFRKMLDSAGFRIKEVKRSKIYIGRMRIIGIILRIFDWPLWKIGLGGQHIWFRAVK